MSKIITDIATSSLSSNNYQDRWEAVEQLQRIGTRSARALIEAALNDRSIDVRKASCEALIAIGSRASSTSILSRLDKEPNPIVRVALIEALALLHDPSAINKLMMLVREDPVGLVRGYAARALGDFRYKQALPKLKRRLELDRSPIARVHLRGALYKLGDHAQLPFVLHGLKSLSYKHRCATVNILGDLASSKNILILCSAVDDAYRTENTRAAQSSMETFLKGQCLKQ